VPDFKYPRAALLHDLYTGRVYQIIQFPNSFARLRPRKNLQYVSGKIMPGELFQIPGLYGNTKHVAQKPETIWQLFGVEEAFHAVCQDAGYGYIFANYADPQISFSQPKSQAEEDYGPAEFVALIAQYLYLTTTHPEEIEALDNIWGRIRDVNDLITEHPYPNYIASSITEAIGKIYELTGRDVVSGSIPLEKYPISIYNAKTKDPRDGITTLFLSDEHKNTKELLSPDDTGE